jgi:hypothetical protein
MHFKEPLFVRVPGDNWVDRQNVRCAIDGRAIEPVWEGDYLTFAEIEAGQTATVEYPLIGKSRTEVLDGLSYRVQWKGQTVLSIDPPGKVAPLFRREGFRTSEAPLKTEPDPRFRPEIDRALNEIDW